MVEVQLSRHQTGAFAHPVTMRRGCPESPGGRPAPGRQVVVPGSDQSASQTREVSSVFVCIFQGCTSVADFSPSAVGQFNVGPQMDVREVRLATGGPGGASELPSRTKGVRVPCGDEDVASIFVLLTLSVRRRSVQISVLLFL